MSSATFYQWRSRYGGLEASELRRIKDLEQENARLKQMYAELSLDHKVLKDIIERFNGSHRNEVLDAWVFMELNQVREETERWVEEYNTIRPHESLGEISPIEFPNDRGHAEISSYAWT